MNFILFLIAVLVVGFFLIKDKLEPSAPALNEKELEQMTNEMIGKSQKECKKILKKYKK